VSRCRYVQFKYIASVHFPLLFDAKNDLKVK
jgi:hypothetical protein